MKKLLLILAVLICPVLNANPSRQSTQETAAKLAEQINQNMPPEIAQTMRYSLEEIIVILKAVLEGTITENQIDPLRFEKTQVYLMQQYLANHQKFSVIGQKATDTAVEMLKNKENLKTELLENFVKEIIEIVFPGEKGASSAIKLLKNLFLTKLTEIANGCLENLTAFEIVEQYKKDGQFKTSNKQAEKKMSPESMLELISYQNIEIPTLRNYIKELATIQAKNGTNYVDEFLVEMAFDNSISEKIRYEIIMNLSDSKVCNLLKDSFYGVTLTQLANDPNTPARIRCAIVERIPEMQTQKMFESIATHGTITFGLAKIWAKSIEKPIQQNVETLMLHKTKDIIALYKALHNEFYPKTISQKSKQKLCAAHLYGSLERYLKTTNDYYTLAAEILNADESRAKIIELNLENKKRLKTIAIDFAMSRKLTSSQAIYPQIATNYICDYCLSLPIFFMSAVVSVLEKGDARDALINKFARY